MPHDSTAMGYSLDMGDFDQQLEAFADQLERHAEREAERAEQMARASAPQMSAEEREHNVAKAQRRTALELARARVLANLKVTAPGRYREQLEQSLAALEHDLGALDG